MTEEMFENEAEEIAKDIYIRYFDDDVNFPEVLKAIMVGVQKGAEFGYNKAKEEMQAQIDNQNHCNCVHTDNSKVIAELEKENRQLRNEVEDLRAYCNQIGKVKTEVLKAFEHIVAR